MDKKTFSTPSQGKGQTACCSVSRPASAVKTQTLTSHDLRGSTGDMVHLAGGAFLMGTDEPTFPTDGEGPVRRVTLSPFWIAPFAVTNAQFARFVEATGYQTEAERFGWSYVFYGFLPEGFPPTKGVAQAPWWRQVFGAYWRRPRVRSLPLTSD